MPAKRELTMRQLRYMLRLHHDGVSARAIGRALGVARSTIQDNLRRAQASGIAWPLPAELTDDVLEQRLFARPGTQAGLRRCSEPDWGTLARELKRPGVNLMVLWEEYRQSEPDGYGYSRFCDLFREFERRLSPVMRQHHVAGDKVFVDYSGKRVAIVHPGTGVVHDAELFVGDRRDLFETIERPALKTLPAQDYEYAEWRLARVGLDYHVEVEGFFYSVPHTFIRAEVDVRIAARTVEVFHRGRRIAAHERRYGGHRHGTDPEHMPSSHRRYAEWTIERILHDAAAIGPSTAKLAALILETRPHPEQGYRACLGILRLARQYGPDRLEAACDRGLDIGARSYGSIQSILKHGLDRQRPQPIQGELLPDHPNIRGSRYYH